MSELTLNQVKEVIKNPYQSGYIKDAIKLQERLKLHLEKTVDLPNWNDAYISYLSWVEGILNNNKKFELFKRLQAVPLDTVSFSQSIFSQYKKVFKTANPKKVWNFKDVKNQDDYSQFLKRYSKFWETAGFEEFQTNICSFVVVDTPEVQLTDLPEPYFYFVNVCNVIAADIERCGKIEWVIFCTKENEYIYIDSTRYLFINKKGEDYTKSKEVIHNFGFTPVRQLWTSNLSKNRFVKDSPIAQSLGKLDKLLFSYTAKEDAQLYAKFPIVWEYEQPQTHQDFGLQQPVSNYLDNTSDEGGYGSTNTTRYASVTDFNNAVALTQGEKSIFKGPGTKLTKPLPNGEVPDLGDPAGFVSADTDSLRFIDDDLLKRENSIWYDSIGSPRIAELNQAVNEKQIHSQFEGAENILLEIKMNFEIIEKWTLETMAKIRYGEDELINVIVDYGDRFFLKSIETLQEELTSAKNSGMPDSFIIDIVEQMIETKYKNDTTQIQRNKLLLHLEPLPTRSIEDMIEINKNFTLSEDVVNKKINFNSLIKRFEREYGSIEKYRQDSTFETRINNIQQILNNYLENGKTKSNTTGTDISE